MALLLRVSERDRKRDPAMLVRGAFEGKMVRDRGRETARSLVMRLLMVHTGSFTSTGFNIEDHVYGLCARAKTGLEFIHQSSHRGPLGLLAKAA